MMTVFVGDILNATAAPVVAYAGSTRTLQWLRTGTAIPSATATSYRVTDAEIDNAISVLQLETNFMGSASATSAPTATVQAWSPAALLAGSTALVWLDPSDLTTLFQDAAGTTPVTAPAQPVGLVLDKSQGLVLGPERISSPTFSPYNANGTVSVSGDVITCICTNSGTYGFTISGPSPVVGASYRASAQVTANSASRGAFFDYGNRTFGLGVTGSRTGYFVNVPQTFVAIIYIVGATAGETFSVSASSLSIKDLAGNHATQSTAASRPTYGVVPSRGRVNLLTFSQDLTNGVWAKGVGVTTTATQATFATGGSSEIVRQFFNFASGQAYTVSFDARSVSGSTALSLDLSNVETQSFTLTATSQRFTWTVTPAAARTWLDFQLGGAGVVELTNIQLETGSTATPYQRVVSQFEVTDPAGFPTYPLHYLSFDGVDDFLQTSTIDPAANAVPGPELVTNGDFSAGSTGWTLNTGWSATTELTASSAAVGTSAFQALSGLKANTTYRVTFNITNYSAGFVYANFFAGATSGWQSGNGQKSVLVTTPASVANSNFGITAVSSAFTGTIDNISVREIVADKVQVFAGVRKLSDAAIGAVVELSATNATNNGAFNIFAPRSATFADYGFQSKGTTNVNATSSLSFAAPISNVLTGLGDISGDRATLRVNGSQAAQSTADQGTGNYLAYPLYIGRRGGTSLPFNGQLYGLITRFSGANLDASVISQTERWMGGKTGVTIA